MLSAHRTIFRQKNSIIFNIIAGNFDNVMKTDFACWTWTNCILRVMNRIYYIEYSVCYKKAAF